MKRQIKFRGKRSDNGMWIDGDLVTSLTPRGSMIKCPAIHTVYGTIGTFFVFPKTVGQNTGFKDCNGREIYEDDIVTDKYGSIGKIAFTDYGWNVDCAGDLFPVVEMIEEGLQVIGNIYDNPELLEGGEE